VDKKLLQRCKAEGPGFYQLRKPDRATQLLQAFTSSTVWSVAETLVGLVQDSTLEQVPKSCAIANILCAAGYFKSEAAGDIMRCADHCLEIGHIAASTLYYQFILDHRQTIADADARQTAFMDAVLGLISSCGHLKPLDQQRSLLSLARDTAIAVKDPYQQCLINLRLAQVLKTEGNYEEAADMYERAWELANQLGREDLLKKAAVYTSDFLFWQGLVADAIARYEQVIGDLEKFPADPSILHACAALGWCYGICGQTARGAGLIEAVLGKAKDLGLVQVHVYALLMGVLNFLEARRMDEAAALLNELFGHPEETLGHYILWAGYASKAFILSCQGDLPGCYLYQIKAYDKSKAFGWHHHRGPWNFDYMDLLEETGVVHPVTSADRFACSSTSLTVSKANPTGDTRMAEPFPKLL
jgi:tetratricopeptide (TPR) repeat protein